MATRQRSRRQADRSGSGAWLAGLGACLCLFALPAIIALLLWGSGAALWPKPLSLLTLDDGRELLGEVAQQPDAQHRDWLLRTGVTGGHGQYERIAADRVRDIARPPQALRAHRADGDQVYALEADAEWALDAIALEQPNRAGPIDDSLEALRRLWQLVAADPSAGTAAGGLWPALIGTVVLVFLMTIVVTPIGVLAALYLHEYARPGPWTRLLRASVNQLAGVPSIVVGMFGLGFFVHTAGGGIDSLFFSEVLPQPTFGAGGLLWAALTLAILTLPVVIVATEEGLARVPQSLRMASLALGATHAETLWQQVLPVARPALLTGAVLAIARAAGEVAPLMLVGVVKLAPALPLDADPPFVHPSRQFMHLGQQVYDTALNHPDALLGAPRAWVCALLLLGVVLMLNLIAATLRQRLRERYRALEPAPA